MQFNQLFPKLKRFSLTVGANLDYSIFECILPHLEHLEIEVLNMQYGWLNANTIEGILRKNPHILSASFKGFPDVYITHIDRFLPNLVNLTLHEFNDIISPVQLKNVKNFILDEKNAHGILNLTIPQLETMEVKESLYRPNEWEIFFRNHLNLRKLTMKLYYENELRVIADLENLEDLSIEFGCGIGSNIISTFIEDHAKLTKLQIKARDHTNIVHRLHQQFDNQWNITSGDRYDPIVMQKWIDV